MKKTEKKLVIGIGNSWRRDDGIGLRVAQALRKVLTEDIQIMEKPQVGIELIEEWSGCDLLIIIDATKTDAAPGTIFYSPFPSETFQWELFGFSSHSVSLGETLELAKALGKLPKTVYLCAIAGVDFGMGVGLSTELEKAIPFAVGRIAQTLRGE